MFNNFLKPYLLVMGAATSELWVSNLLESMRKSSEELYNHSVLVALLTANYALYADTDMMDEFGNDIDSLIKGALLHDVGNICNIGKSINKHRSEMSKIELEMFEKHITYGFEAVNKYTDKQIILEIVAMHHEYIDGSGFPNGSKEDELPPYVKLVSVANAFASYITHSIAQGIPFNDLIEDFRYNLLAEGVIERYDIEILDTFLNNIFHSFVYLLPIVEHFSEEDELLKIVEREASMSVHT